MNEHRLKQIKQHVLFVQNEQTWKEFDRIVEATFGKYHKSKTVERLIWYNLNNLDSIDLIDLPENDSININITVNYALWSTFLKNIEQIYGTKKTQSRIIHSIICNLIRGRTDGEISSLLKLIYSRFEIEYEKPFLEERKGLNHQIHPLSLTPKFKHEKIKLKRLRNIIVHSSGSLTLETIYKSMNIEHDSEFLELISYLEPRNIRIDWDKRKFIIIPS